jgi:hypothetical protein
VAKKKDAKSLFEIFTGEGIKSKADKPLGVPGWFGQAEPVPPAASESPAQAVRPAAVPPAVSTERRLPEEPVVSVVGGRLRISLSQVGGAVTVLAVLVLLIGMFFVGRWSAPVAGRPPVAGKAGQTEPAEAGGVPPLPRLDSAGQRVPPVAPPVATGRTKGHYYLVFKVGLPVRADAEDIKSFLQEKKIYATVYRSRLTGKWLVRDLRGFPDKNSPVAVAYQKNAEDKLGNEYFKRSGLAGRPRWDFRGCYYSLEQ